MYWFDIGAFSVIFIFIILGFSGWLDSLRGLVFGMFFGIFVVAVIAVTLTSQNNVTKVSIVKERSVVLRFIDDYIDKFKTQTAQTDLLWK